MRLSNSRWIIALTLVALFVAVPVAFAQEEGGSPLDALGINMGFLIAQLINFGIVFVVLTALMWRPLINMLDARSAKIQKGLEDAQAAANARLNAEAEAEKILQQARAEAQTVIDDSRGRGEEVARQVEQEARAEAEQIREEARQAAVEERNAQLAGLRSQVAAISIAVAQRLIGEALDEQRQQALINDFFAQVPAEARSLSGNVVVVSAMPLTEAEQNKARQEIGAENVSFQVDPSILGGLIVRSEDRVVDGSVRSGLSEISQRIR